jgi:hypothetical protein
MNSVPIGVDVMELALHCVEPSVENWRARASNRLPVATYGLPPEGGCDNLLERWRTCHLGVGAALALACLVQGMLCLWRWNTKSHDLSERLSGIDLR